MADPLDTLSQNLAPFDQANAAQPSSSIFAQPSLAFTAANSSYETPAVQLLANYSAQQASIQQAGQDPGPDTSTSTDPVVGNVPTNTITKHKGLLSHFGAVMNVLGDGKRFFDHLDRLAKSAGVPGWVMPVVGGASAIAGGVIAAGTAPVWAAAGGAALLGAGAVGAIGAIEHTTKGDLSQAWQASMKGQTMGQMLASSVHFTPGSVGFKIISGTADAGFAMSSDPSSYLGTPFKAVKAMEDARLAAAAKDGVEGIETFARNYKPTTAFVEWARGQNPYTIIREAAASGSHIPQATAVALSDARDVQTGLHVLATHAALYGSRTDRFAIDRLPAMYKAPVLKQVQQLHMWEGPKFLHVTPSATWDMSNGTFDAVDQAKKQFETWYMRGLNVPQEKQAYNAFIASKMDQFIRAGKSDQLQMIYDAQFGPQGGLKALGLTDDQIKRMASEHNWLGMAQVKLAKDKLNLGQNIDAFAAPTYADLGEARRLGMPGVKGELMRKGASLEERATAVTNKMKVLWLARPAYILRVALDEGLNSMARFGVHPLEWANSASDAWIKSFTMNPKAGPVRHELADALQFVHDHLTTEVTGFKDVPKMATPREVLSAGMDRDVASVRKLRLGISDTGYREPPTHLNPAIRWLQQEGTKSGIVGKYMLRGESGYDRSLIQIANYQIRRDPVGIAMLNVENQSKAAIMAAGKLAYVDHPDATPPTMMYNLLFKGPGDIGPIVPKGLRPVLATRDLSMNDLAGIDRSTLPYNIWGPSSKTGGGLLHTFSEGFHHSTATFLNNTVRTPTWQMQYMKTYQSLLKRATDTGALDAGEISRDELAHQAANSTTRDVLSAIHRTSERTRLDVLTKSFIPFNYAWIQFVKRWGTTFEKNPGFVRALANITAAGKTDGWFDQNPYGQLEWHFPVGNDFAQHFLSIQAPTANLPFVPPMLPFSTQTLPGLSPIVTVPVNFLVTHALPTVSRGAEDKALSVENALFGPSFGSVNQPGMGFANTILGQIAPSWVNKLSMAVQGDLRDNAYGKSVIAALQYHWMKGDFNPPPQNPGETDADYQARVTRHFNDVKQSVLNESRLLHVVQSAEAFFSPYAPLPNTDGMKIPSDIRQMRAKFGPQAATKMALDKYGPNAEAYLTGSTQVSKGTLPTQAFQDFYNSHPDFFTNYPNVAAFFAPQDQGFSSFAYQEQKITGQRTSLTPNEWLLQVAIRQGDNLFYSKVKPIYDQAVAAGVSSRALAPWYAAQKQQIDDMYPGWLAYRNAASDREAQRIAAIQELQQAADDPASNNMTGITGLRNFLLNYNQAKTALQAQGLSSLTSKTAQPVRTYLNQVYLEDVQTRNPDAVAQAEAKAGTSDPGIIIANLPPLTNLSPLDEAFQYLFRYELNDFATA